jgi:arylsulfatase A-like enzyme
MTDLRPWIAVAVLANMIFVGWLLLAPEAPTGGGPGAPAAALAEDPTMAANRYALPTRDRPLNVILISLDALRYDRTGLAGGDGPSNTPNLDAFAAESVVFHAATSAAPWTLPSHMSVWTARWPSAHRLTNKLELLGPDAMAEASLAPAVPTYPHALTQQGYTAVGFTGGAGVSGRYGFSRGFEAWLDDRPFAGLGTSVPPALAWLDARPPDRPFFLFLHGYDAHGQHPLPDSLIQSIPYEGSLNGSIEENARLREQGLSAIQAPGQDASLQGTLQPADAAFLLALYDRKVQQADERLGAFLEHLRRADLLDQSLVIVFSDHGDEFMEHGHIDHGHTLYEEQLHTVLMMRVPGYARRHDIPEVVRTIDIFPTVFELLGLPPIPGVDGASLLPLMRGQGAPRPAFAETDYRLYVHRRAVRDGRYKLTLDLQDGGRALYDLEADPGETRDISAAEPRRSYELEQALRGWMGELGVNPQDYLGLEQKPIAVF